MGVIFSPLLPKPLARELSGWRPASNIANVPASAAKGAGSFLVSGMVRDPRRQASLLPDVIDIHIVYAPTPVFLF